MTRRFLAEYEPQQHIIMAWPHANTDWERLLEDAQEAMLTFIKAVALHQHVKLIVNSIEGFGHTLENVELIEARYDNTWMRDVMPLSFKEGETTRYANFIFNAWGGKYTHDNDARLSAAVYTHYEDIAFVLEGGGVEHSGDGVMMVRTETFLDPHRNKGMTRTDIEEFFAKQFGVKKILWLEHGALLGDDTDAHIDTLARFISKDTILYVAPPEDQNDPHYDDMVKMEQQLKTFTQLNGTPYTLIALPFAPAVYEESRRLPATYANFLLVNGAVIYPTYDDPKDTVVKTILASQFPDRVLEPVESRSFIRENGSLHCLTMNMH